MCARLSLLRKMGWRVAVHNDYEQDGEFHTFWLFTLGGRCIKGEGTSDYEALREVWKQAEALMREAGRSHDQQLRH